MIKICTICGRAMEGRSDKRFCSAKCSWTFHNWNRRGKEAPIDKEALKKNLVAELEKLGYQVSVS